MSAAPFDALKLSRQSRERARFDQDQAEGLAEALAEAFHEQIATKADLQAAVKDLHGELTTATVPILIVSRCSSSKQQSERRVGYAPRPSGIPAGAT